MITVDGSTVRHWEDAKPPPGRNFFFHLIFTTDRVVIGSLPFPMRRATSLNATPRRLLLHRIPRKGAGNPACIIQFLLGLDQGPVGILSGMLRDATPDAPDPPGRPWARVEGGGKKLEPARGEIAVPGAL